MAPTTRKSQASNATEAPTHAEHLSIILPSDLLPSQLDTLTGSTTDWTAPTPETIISLYRLVLSQKQEFDAALQDWEHRLEQKDADLEQVLQDQETHRQESNEAIEQLKIEVERLKTAGTEVENERARLAGQLASLASSNSVSGRETEMLKHQVEEREREKKTLTDTLDAALTRETRLHGENGSLREEIQAIRKTASDLTAKLAETSSSERTLSFKVSTLEQQISLLQESNEKLNNELSAQLTRYSDLRRTRTEEVSSLQSKLDQKTSAFDRETERARTLQAAGAHMERKLSEALEQVRDLSSAEASNARAFADEMAVCKDLLAQYERIADEAKARVEEIEKEEDSVRREVSKREEVLLAQTDRERERAEAAEAKVEELEGVLARVQSGELSMNMSADASFIRAGTPGTPGPNTSMTMMGTGNMSGLMLSPTASIVSKLQRGGRSITEVYADYVRLQKELAKERQEKARLETTLSDIYNEIEDRAPILTQQRLEYARVSEEARQLASQLSQAMEDRDQQARAAREANHTLQSKQKEIDLLNKQQVDLSRQVRGLMHQLARAIDPTLPDEFTDQLSESSSNNNNGIIDADSFVSSNLVLLRDLPHLQQQNMTLLKLTRSLAQQLEERERAAQVEEAESEMMAEARMVIESLQVQLKTSQQKMEAYIKERDVFKAMASRRQGGGAVEITSTESRDNAMVVDGAVDYHQKYDEEHATLEALKRETAKDFDTLRAELKRAKSESTDLHVQLGKARATVEYHVERYKLLQSSTASQAEELKTISGRNNELESYVRQAESKIGELSSSLATYSGNLSKAQSEAQLLRSEKNLQKSREERLEQENRQLHAERSRNSQTLEDYRRMKDELSSLWEENKQALEKEKTRLTSEVTALRDELMNDRASGRSRITEKEVEVRDLNHRLSQMNEEVVKSREAAAVAQANQAHLQARSDDLNKQLHRALEKLTVFERRPGTMGLMSTTGASEEENLRAQVAELSAELKSVQLELTSERANGLMYQELAQTTEQALEDLRRSTDEFTAKSQQDLAVKETQLLSVQERLAALQIEKQAIAEQKAALEAEIETKEAQFAQEKKLLEDIVAEVQGADARALRDQQSSHQEFLAEAQKTREVQQKYQSILIDHSALLKERDILQQQSREAQSLATKSLEDARTAQSILSTSEQSWKLQADSINQELADIRSRYDSLSAQNDMLHKQLASVTAQAAKVGDLSESSLAAMHEPSSDTQVQELQQVIQHVKREADLLRGQHELLKRENARITGDVRRLTSELELTRQRLSEERELASKAALAPNDQQALLAKVSENASLIEGNRVLRAEKATLEQRLAKKSDELIAAESEISPLKQEVITLRSERDYMKVENETLQTSIDQWRKRATSIMTKFERIDPEAHEQLKAEKEQLEVDLVTLRAQLTKSDAAVARWKDAQQQWKNAHERVASESKERQNQLISERDAVVSQNEATTKELESAKAELQSLGRPSTDVDSTTLNAEITQLNAQKATLLAENAALKEQLASLQAGPDAAASTTSAELERSIQAAKDAQKRLADVQARSRAMAQEIAKLREKIAALEKEKGDATATPELEVLVAQRLEAARVQAHEAQNAAVAAATGPLQEQLRAMSQGQPEVARIQAQYAAEIKSLQDRLVLAESSTGSVNEAVVDQMVEGRLNERLAAIQEEHNQALAKATENGRMEGETKFKMLNIQLARVRSELAQLKSGGATAPKVAPGTAPSPAQTAPAVKTEAIPGTLPPANAGQPGGPMAARGRGRGVPPVRGAPMRGRGGPPGVGRGSVLDAVNQAIAGGGPAPTSPGSSLSILGASGGKRARDEDEAADPGALAKRLKPEEASGLPPKPAGRGGAVALNRNRAPGAPGPS